MVQYNPAFADVTSEELFAQWQVAKKTLAAVKEHEMALRKEVAARAFPEAKPGTQRVPLNDGSTLKLVHKEDYRLAPYDDVQKVLAEIRQAGNEGTFIADRLVKFKADISIKEYKALEPGSPYKQAIDKVLTISDAAPTLEIEPPKGA